MVLNNPKSRPNQVSFGGFQTKRARIQQIVPERAVAIVIDELNLQHEVPLNVQKSKGRLPKENEIWYLERMMNQWVFSSFVADTYDQFPQWHLVTVRSIDPAGIATVEDESGRQLKVDTKIRRSKGTLAPEVGERWYIDNAIADQYTFAAYLEE